MTPRWVATINVPGYLPMDDDPPVFDTVREAWEWLVEERRRSEEDAPDYREIRPPGRFVRLTLRALQDEARHPLPKPGVVYGDDPGYEGDHDLGLAYSVTEAVTES